MPYPPHVAFAPLVEADLRRVEQLQHLILAIDDALQAPDDLQKFRTVIAYAIDETNVKQADIAREFRIDRSGVKRWASGEHAPRVYARPAILAWLKSDVERHIHLILSKPEVAKAVASTAAVAA